MKKKFNTIKLAIISTLATLLFIPASASAATVSLNSFDLVDSGKHLDYDGNSKYMGYIQKGAGIWNAYKSGVIRPDDAFVIEDVYVSDFYQVSITAGETYSDGRMRLNTYQLDGDCASYAERLNVAAHELGHALGLGHNQSTDIMYKNVTTINTLSANDKASYNTASILY